MVRIGRLGSVAIMIRSLARRGFACSLRIFSRSTPGSVVDRDIRSGLGDGAQLAAPLRGLGLAHAAGPAEDAALLDADAAGADVALDSALGQDLQVARADDVADHRAGDDDVGPAHAAADGAGLAHDDRRL